MTVDFATTYSNYTVFAIFQFQI